MTPKDLAPILKQLRTQSKKVQREIAGHLDVAVSTITHIEIGRRLPSVDILFGWVEYCGGSIRIFLKDEHHTPPPPHLKRLVDIASHLPPDDVRRLEATAHALNTVDGLARDMLLVQLDGIAVATSKSTVFAENEPVRLRA